MVVGRPLEHISALSSKTVGGREKVFGVTCHVPGELPFTDMATVQWLTTRPVEARVLCTRPTDPSTDRTTDFFFCAHITQKCFDWFWCLKTAERLSGRTRPTLCTKFGGWEARMGVVIPRHFWFFKTSASSALVDDSIFLTFYWADFVDSGAHNPKRDVQNFKIE